jgi:tetratricopeptide (TPR) repeat protein
VSGSIVSANRENLSDRSNAPAAPIGVRTRAAVAGHWALLVFFFAASVAVVVFVLLPGWLAPGRPPALPAAKSASASAAREAPIAKEPPVSKQAPASAEVPPPVHEQSPALPPDAVEAAQPDRAVDPAKGPTEKPPPRADRNVADQQFAQLMSRGLAHADRAEWPDAERAFRAAAQLRPADRAAADGLARAKEGLERSRVTVLRSEAERSESEERWADALARYRQALRIDPTLEFAKRGGERSERMVQLHAELDAMLADPKRLYSPPVREAGRKTLAAADAVPGGGPRLADARARLDVALRRATTPIVVRLASDEATDVTVYRVGSLGQFKTRDVELVPGAYTVVGSRAGLSLNCAKRSVPTASNGWSSSPLPHFLACCASPCQRHCARPSCANFRRIWSIRTPRPSACSPFCTLMFLRTITSRYFRPHLSG